MRLPAVGSAAAGQQAELVLRALLTSAMPARHVVCGAAAAAGARGAKRGLEDEPLDGADDEQHDADVFRRRQRQKLEEQQRVPVA